MLIISQIMPWNIDSTMRNIPALYGPSAIYLNVSEQFQIPFRKEIPSAETLWQYPPTEQPVTRTTDG